MESILIEFIGYKFPLQAKTYLSVYFKYLSYMLAVPYFLYNISDDKALVLNNTNTVLHDQLNLPFKEIPNIRIGSSHKPRTSGKDAKFPNFININVTSVVKSLFSPLKGDTHPVTSFDGIIYHNFENWWQAQKIFPDLGHIKDGKLTDKFFKWRKDWAEEKTGHRILTFDVKTHDKSVKSTAKSTRSQGFKPMGAYHDGKIVDYVQSRDYYLREYIKVIKNKTNFKTLVDRVNKGENIMILDLDGPSLDKYPQGIPATWEFMQKAMDDPDHPFGHGYVICCLLLSE